MYKIKGPWCKQRISPALYLPIASLLSIITEVSLLAYVVDFHKVEAFSKTKQTKWNTIQINPTWAKLRQTFQKLLLCYDTSKRLNLVLALVSFSTKAK